MQRVKVTISLPVGHARALRELANDQFHGNSSAVVRAALETSRVTKSAFALALGATPRG